MKKGSIFTMVIGVMFWGYAFILPDTYQVKEMCISHCQQNGSGAFENVAGFFANPAKVPFFTFGSILILIGLTIFLNHERISEYINKEK